jgi:hypothetical protein
MPAKTKSKNKNNSRINNINSISDKIFLSIKKRFLYKPEKAFFYCLSAEH